MNRDGTELEQIVHTHRTSYRSGLSRGACVSFSVLSHKYLLPSQWVPVLFPTYSLLLPSENLFTLHQTEQYQQTIFICTHSRSKINYDNGKIKGKFRGIGWLPGITMGATGAR